MRLVTRDVLCVAVVATVVMFANLGGAPLWDRDEPRNAGCAREMLTRGDWVTPVFNAQLRTHKPVLLYWFIMSAYSMFGVNEFSARFWSAALAVGTALCTYVMGRRLFRPSVGVWSGIILSSALLFVVAGRAATPDSTLIFFSTLAITIYVVGVFPRAPRAANEPAGRPYFPSWPFVIAMNLSLGMALLAKGPVGFVLPTAVIGMFLLIMRLPQGDEGHPIQNWRGRLLRVARVLSPLHFLRTCWSMRPVTALAASLAVALPWYVWVGLRSEGEFLRSFFLEHNLSRAMASMEGHAGSILFYPVAILIGFFPWSIFAVPLSLDATRHGRSSVTWRPGYVFATCWLGVYVGIFSLAQTKLPSYVSPSYPALALLAGAFVDRLARGEVALSRWWLRVAFGISAAVGLGIVIALPLVAQEFSPGWEWLGLIGLLPLAGGGGALWFLERQEWPRATWVFASSAVAFVVCAFGIVAAQVGHQQRYEQFLQTVKHQRARDVQLAAFGHLEPSWVFYSGLPVWELMPPGAGPLQTRWIERDGHWEPAPRTEVADLLREHPHSYFITTDRHAEALRALVPEDYEVLAETQYFLRSSRLMLIGPRDPNLTARESAAQEPSLR